MVTNVATAEENQKIEAIKKLLLKKKNGFSSLNYIYIVNSNGVLKGVISLRELLEANPHKPIKTVMQKRVVSVRPHTDQERAALLALEHHLKSIPVVDKNNHFLGILSTDTIFNVLHNEGVENIMRLGGVTKGAKFDDIFNLPLRTSIIHRLPWLLIGLLGGLMAAIVVNSFEDLLAKNLILAAFIPLVVYMADAVGTQMEAFIIRDLALHPDLKFLSYFLKQALIVLVIAAIISGATYLISDLIYHNSSVSLVLMWGLFFAILSSLVTGLLVPYFFGRIKMDPANASGPIATTIQDVLSIVIYFAIATLILL